MKQVCILLFVWYFYDFFLRLCKGNWYAAFLFYLYWILHYSKIMMIRVSTKFAAELKISGDSKKAATTVQERENLQSTIHIIFFCMQSSHKIFDTIVLQLMWSVTGSLHLQRIQRPRSYSKTTTQEKTVSRYNFVQNIRQPMFIRLLFFYVDIFS